LRDPFNLQLHRNPKAWSPRLAATRSGARPAARHGQLDPSRFLFGFAVLSLRFDRCYNSTGMSIAEIITKQVP
jgi:hypothetical protein